MVSFDVVSLFTKIPINLAKNVACEQLTNDIILSERTEMTINNIEISLNFCFNNTYFTCQEKFLSTNIWCSNGLPYFCCYCKFTYGAHRDQSDKFFFSPIQNYGQDL